MKTLALVVLEITLTSWKSVRKYEIQNGRCCLSNGLRNCVIRLNKFYVSKLPRAFVFRSAFYSAKFKILIFFCLKGFFFFFFHCFMKFLVKIYMERYERHNKTLWTTDFFNSVLCLVSCSSKNQVPYFILN